jgi:hypothetical protein
MSAQPNDDQKPQVEYRRLGKSGLRVSVPILGAMSFGSDKWVEWVINEAEVRNFLVKVANRGQQANVDAGLVGAPVAEGGMGARGHDMGHGKRVLEWRV